jgi:hypothetical protein
MAMALGFFVPARPRSENRRGGRGNGGLQLNWRALLDSNQRPTA